MERVKQQQKSTNNSIQSPLTHSLRRQATSSSSPETETRDLRYKVDILGRQWRFHIQRKTITTNHAPTNELNWWAGLV